MAHRPIPRKQVLTRHDPAMLTAEGVVQIGPSNQPGSATAATDESNGAAAFLLAHLGPDQADERAAETSPVFLAHRNSCGAMPRSPPRRVETTPIPRVGQLFRPHAVPTNRRAQGEWPAAARIDVIAVPRAQAARQGRPDQGNADDAEVFGRHCTRTEPLRHRRRTALADEITKPDNFWFAAAFVNRTWGELMGQSFAQPVDDMGPGRDVFMPAVLVRMSASFRATDYDIKQLVRTICNSAAYQRQIRPGVSSEEHLRFASAYPTRLPAEALWQSLVNVLGPLGPPLPPRLAAAAAFAPGGRQLPLQLTFLNEFRFDPSLKADDVESSIPQRC